MVILISFATFVATLCGGLLALRFRDKLHLILGFSAGAVLGVAFFDLLPESLDLGGKFFSGSTVTAIVALGFFVYLVLDRVVFLHAHEETQQRSDLYSGEQTGNHDQDRGRTSAVSPTSPRGILGAGSLSIHSFLDGVAIGLAFQVSVAIGAVVAVAVLAHDFSDGINTVNLVLKNDGHRKQAFRWLLVDAIAPVVGAASTLFFHLPEQGLSIVLALFTGFFLYIGASDLLPESYHAHPKFLTTVMTLAGAAVLFIAIHLANF